ncbi:MAG: LicD family protein [Ruminococcus sp.]|nr:LicD family protein [Ruminococcus sp.]
MNKREITVEESKQLQVEMLAYIDSVCRENNINYCVGFGTLIGAIRHKGFIPWDDDIDIWLLREDYEKLCSILKQKTEYVFLSDETDPDYYFAFSRIYDNRTEKRMMRLPQIKNLGIQIDIFPMDNMPDENVKEYVDNLIELEKKMFAVIPFRCKYSFHNKDTFVRSLKRIAKRILNPGLSFKKARQQYIDYLQSYNSSECKNVGIPTIMYREKTLMDRSWFERFEDHPFENITVRIPCEYDKILRAIYGNYMQLPPAEKRVSHHSFKAYWKEQ